MNFTSFQKILLSSIVVVAGSGLLGYAVYESNQKLLDSKEWVHHSERVLYQTSYILLLGKDIESSSRGFVITNDSTFLEPLHRAEKVVFDSIARLRQFTSDNPRQFRRMDSLKYYTQMLLSLSHRQVQGKDSTVFLARSDVASQGRLYTDKLREITTAIQREEALLLLERIVANEKRIAVFNRFWIAMVGLMALLMILLLIVTGNYWRQNEEKVKRAAELSIANIELDFQNREKEKRADELLLANQELIVQNKEKEKRAAELIVANQELAFQNNEKEKRAAELIVANHELAFQNKEKENRAAELKIANTELVFQNGEKEKRSDELGIANHELAFQNKEKEKRAAELKIANTELVFQNGEKGKRADELGIANLELAFQNKEKEKRAAELDIANQELIFQNGEKGKRADELGIANLELAFQNKEKEKRAAELDIANKELTFQNGEKEKRANELGVANQELAFQNEEKEKRASELLLVNKELEAFAYVSSHDMQEPLRKIRTFATRILETENENLSEKGKDYLDRMQKSANRMQQLINDLLAFSRLNVAERKFELTDLNKIVEDVKAELKESIDDKNAVIESIRLCKVNIIPFQFHQLMYNLISNALKFSKKGEAPHIIIKSEIKRGAVFSAEEPTVPAGKLVAGTMYCCVSVSDNGIGFSPQYKDLVFEVFQKLHSREEYAGTGIGLAIVKKIVENHKGFITVASALTKGARFTIYFPVANDPARAVAPHRVNLRRPIDTKDVTS